MNEFKNDPAKYAKGLETSKGIESMNDEQYEVYVEAKTKHLENLKAKKLMSRTTLEEILRKLTSKKDYIKFLQEKEERIKKMENAKEQEWQEYLKKSEEINAEKNRKQQEEQEAKKQEIAKKIAETYEFISSAIKEHGEERVRADLEDALVGNKSKVNAVIKGERSLTDDELKTLKNYLTEKKQETEKKEKVQKKYVQQEIDGMKKRGGWRGGGRPKSTGQTTVAVRIDKRLENLVNALKEELKNGTIDEKEIELLLMRTQKQKGEDNGN